MYLCVWVDIDKWGIKKTLVVQMLQHLCDTKAICVSQWNIWFNQQKWNAKSGEIQNLQSQLPLDVELLT